jgi:DinB superfamily
MTSDIETLRARLRSDLEAARQEFHEMVGSISEQRWDKPSHNPGWTNGQLLFHVLLGFILVLPLAGILIFFGHLPAVCSRIFAAILNFSTPLFNRINAVGPRAGARLVGRAGLISKFDRVHEAILERLERVRPGDWALAMDCQPHEPLATEVDRHLVPATLAHVPTRPMAVATTVGAS